MKRPIPLHPFFLVLFHILYMFPRAGHIVSADKLLVPVILSLIVVSCLIAAGRLIMRDWEISALLTTAVVLLALLLEPTFNLLSRFRIPLPYESRHDVLLVVWLLLSFGAVVLLRRLKSVPPAVTSAFNVAGLSAVLISLIAVVTVVGPSSVETRRVDVPAGAKVADRSFPPVYYVILDGFPATEVLRDYYGYDNTSFTDSLKSMGFFVVPNARSNYSQTMLSFASTLNLTYIDSLIPERDIKSEDRRPLKELIDDNALQRFLGSIGYTTVNFSSGYGGADLHNAEHHPAPFFTLDELGVALLRSTILPALIDKFVPDWQYRLHRRRLEFIFEEIPKLRGRVFVVAHILAPHPPFVFRSDGGLRREAGPLVFGDGPLFVSRISPTAYVEHYHEQIQFVEKKVLRMVNEVFENAPEPPVLILQGDHGPRLTNDHREAVSILNAVFMPGGASAIDTSITPVNTFPLVVNNVFGVPMGRKVDRSYFSWLTHPYMFIPVAADSLLQAAALNSPPVSEATK